MPAIVSADPTYLVTLVNDKTFFATQYPDRAAAEKAAGSIVSEVGAWIVTSESDAAQLSGKLLVDMYNAFSDQKVQKFENRATGARRLLSVLPTVAKSSKTAQEKKTMSDETKGKRGRARKLNETDVITITTEEGKNPKREGSAIHGKFAQLVSGQTTVGQAYEIGFSSHDLLWDQTHGFIRIDPAPQAAAAE